MSHDQIAISIILAGTVSMFLWGRWRHDMVAAGALFACVFTGLVPGNQAFSGFGHPAIITVACVLVLSMGLQTTGAIDALTQRILPKKAGPTASIMALTVVAAIISGFMNNVGALALMMPVAMQIAEKQNLPPGKILMPLSFASILGGTMTLIGTPPNLIVAGFRAETNSGSFTIFDFTPVGLAITAAGVFFVALLGWRMVPARRQMESAGFETGSYLTEVRILEGSILVGKTLNEAEKELYETDAQIISLVRNDLRLLTVAARHVLRADDILVVEAEPRSLAAALSGLGLALEENLPVSDPAADQKCHEQTAVDQQHILTDRTTMASEDAVEQPCSDDQKSSEPWAEDTVLQELVVLPNAALAGRSASDISLRTRYGINLLAISHQGHRSIKRLRTTTIQAGDVILMLGSPEALSVFATEFGCLPLAKREIRVPQKSKAVIAASIMAGAVAASTFNVVPVAVSFAAAVLAFMSLKIVGPRTVYQAVDWPVLVLLGALLPVADAMSTTGTADQIARLLLDSVVQGEPAVALVVVMVVTMFLSDVMNNAATAAVMCPIALSAAGQLQVNPDGLLMGVAIGASCAFLTPIGHQNNTLILGPGEFRFGDYWRMGLALEAIVLAVSVPVILRVWPM